MRIYGKRTRFKALTAKFSLEQALYHWSESNCRMLKGVAAMMQLREVLARRRQEDLFVLASTVGHTVASLASRDRSCCWAAKAASR
jgi:hypothetical protein